MSCFPQKFSLTVAVCFTLNYTIGSGFLTLPWAFEQAGYILGPLTLIVMSSAAWICCYFVLEAIARANALADVSEKTKGYGAISNTEIEESKLPSTTNKVDTSVVMKVGERRFEFPELCEIFLGATGRSIYLVSFSLYAYGAMWAYSTVFASAWATVVPLPAVEQYFHLSSSYNIYLIVWALIEVPWSLMELDEQIAVQIVATIGRVILVSIMILTVFFADYMDEDSFGIGIVDEKENMRENSLFDVKNLFIILPICAYANNMHHSITTLTTPLEDKSQVSQVFNYSFIISFVAYVMLGLTVAMYFGTDNQPSSNLNWNTYVGLFGDTTGTPLYAKAIKFYTILFPSIDVASTYPLYAVTLGNNLYSFSKGVKEDAEQKEAELSSGNNNDNEDRLSRSLFRLAAAVPPIIGGYFISNLGNITAYTGLTGLAIGITFPSLLSYCSKRKMDAMGLSNKTDYTFEMSNVMSLMLMSLSVIMLAYILYCFICIRVPDGVRR